MVVGAPAGTSVNVGEMPREKARCVPPPAECEGIPMPVNGWNYGDQSATARQRQVFTDNFGRDPIRERTFTSPRKRWHRQRGREGLENAERGNTYVGAARALYKCVPTSSTRERSWRKPDAVVTDSLRA